MQRYTEHSRMFEPATYRIAIMGALDKKWSDYRGGITIEHHIVPDQYPITILTGRLADQGALVGIINTLYDLGFPIILVECVEDGVTSGLFRFGG